MSEHLSPPPYRTRIQPYAKNILEDPTTNGSSIDLVRRLRFQVCPRTVPQLVGAVVLVFGEFAPSGESTVRAWTADPESQDFRLLDAFTRHMQIMQNTGHSPSELQSSLVNYAWVWPQQAKGIDTPTTYAMFVRQSLSNERIDMIRLTTSPGAYFEDHAFYGHPDTRKPSYDTIITIAGGQVMNGVASINEATLLQPSEIDMR